MASRTAALVMALKVTRSTFLSFSTLRARSTSSTCHEMASPSRSGSVARITLSDAFTARTMSLMCLVDLSPTSHSMAKSCSGSTEPSLAGRSRTWPKEANTS